MQEFPHHYSVTVAGAIHGDVELTAERLPNLRSASPAEFDGPGDRWSPETSLRCHVTGILDRVDRVTQFTHLDVDARLMLPAGTDPDVARRALEQAERSCLISNSLKATIHLEPDLDIAAERFGVLTGVAN